MKLVIIINSSLPKGLCANTAAIIGMSIGKLNPEFIGYDIKSHEDVTYSGITSRPVPVLKTDEQNLKEIFKNISVNHSETITSIPFTKTAQMSKTYDDYSEKLKKSNIENLDLNGLGLIGPKDIIDKITDGMKLL